MRWRDELLRRFPALAALPPGCLVVGGAIRDLLDGREPADVDVASAHALPAAESIGGRVIRLGRDHLSAWRVTTRGHVYDFADLLDGSIDADLARRDFTVNAMAVELDSSRFLDPHHGQDDLRRRLVRMIRAENFDDDPLRVLKAIRMAVRYAMTLDQQTHAAMLLRAPRIRSIAPERVTYELSVIFSAGAFRRAISLLRQTELDVPLFGGPVDATKFEADDVPLAAAMALLVRDPRAHAKQWRWSEAVLRQTIALQRLMETKGDLRVALYDAGSDVAAQFPPLLRAIGRNPDVPMPDFTIRPLLTGEEIAELTGLPPGRELGLLKRSLLEAQIKGKVKTRRGAVGWVQREKRT